MSKATVITRSGHVLAWVLATLAIPACTGGGGGNPDLSRVRNSKLQPEWVWQNPLPLGNTLSSVVFATACDGWAVGDGGAVIVTHDAGATWNAVPSGETRNLGGVSALPTGQVWAVGAGGAILYSNGCDGFVHQESGTTRDLKAVFFISPTKGWAAGDGVLLRTQDGGVTWTTQEFAVPGYPFTSMAFANETTGWASGVNPGLYSTEDGGASWTQLRGPFAGFSSISFPDARNGWGVTEGIGGGVAHSTDGGVTWLEQSTPLNRHFAQLGGVHFFDDLNGWAVGDVAEIIHTTDGGQSWTIQRDASRANPLRSIAATDPSHAVLVGVNGQILVTSDAGAIWTDPFAGSRASLTDLEVLDENEAWALGEFDLLHTVDGGAHWTLEPKPPRLISISAARYPGASGPVLWATNEFGVLKSLDRGQTWTSMSINGVAVFLNAVSFPDPMHGWVAGPGGAVFATSDGGATWTPQVSGITGDIFHLRFASAKTGWLTSDFEIGGQTLRVTKDGGATWSAGLPQGATLTVFDLVVLDEKRVVVVGSFGTAPDGAPANLALTNDGGVTWAFEQIGPQGAAVSSVSFANQTGWLLLDGAQLYRSSDGGLSWSLLPPPTVQTFRRIRFANPEVGWIVGTGGSILKSKSGKH